MFSFLIISKHLSRVSMKASRSNEWDKSIEVRTGVVHNKLNEVGVEQEKHFINGVGDLLEDVVELLIGHSDDHFEGVGIEQI